MGFSTEKPVTIFNWASTNTSLQHLRLTKYLSISVKNLELLFYWRSLASWCCVLLLLHRAHHMPWGAVSAAAWITSAHSAAGFPSVHHSLTNCEDVQGPGSYCQPKGIKHLEWQLKLDVQFGLYHRDPSANCWRSCNLNTALQFYSNAIHAIHFKKLVLMQ